MAGQSEANKLKSINNELDLEKSLSPIWKSTYYLGLTFDWCHRIPNQSRASFIVHYIIIFASFIFLVYCIVSTTLELNRDLKDPKVKFRYFLNDLTELVESLIILFMWLYFLLHKAKIRAFFNAWAHMEKQHVKGIDAAKIKRAVIFIYILYYSYGLFFLVYYTSQCVDSIRVPITEDDDIMFHYYPNLISYVCYTILVRIKFALYTFFYAIFYPMNDIVPTFVYYHAAKIVESMKFEIQELTRTNNEPSQSQEESIYSVWSRLENLIVLKGRVDKLFGGMVIICHGMLFFNICCFVYSFLDVIKPASTADSSDELSVLLTCLFFYPSRLVFNVWFMSKLHNSSGQLLTVVSHFSLNRTFIADEKERQIVQSLLGRLNESKLAAYPSGFYQIKPSVVLTLLSLIVTYTIILLQTNIK